MPVQPDLSMRIVNAIARRAERIARWDKQAAAIESSWNGAVAYRAFCEAMSSAARSKKTELETELKRLRGAQCRS
jgi:hypothetical protein